MKLALNKELCSGCSACAQICSHGAITMNADSEGFVYPKINESLCVECGLCEKVCPYIESEKKIVKNSSPEVYAAWHLDEDIRKVSSSGGVFTALASYVLENNGAVVGAGFNKDLKLQHQVIDQFDQLTILRGSKYLQSDINNTFSETKELLKSNKIVLFVGTPCQIGGLKSFLFNKDYENLITCDIVCHGVPSPLVFSKYIKEKELEFKDIIVDVNFRGKQNGWKAFTHTINCNNQSFSCHFSNDVYMKGFLQNLYLRPSCYSCLFANKQRPSDITLGDYWGIQNFYPQLDDDKGTSLVLIHSNKGEEILKDIQNNIFMASTTLESAIAGNPCIIKPVLPHVKRKKFFNNIDDKDFSLLINRYCASPSLLKRVLNKIKRIIIVKFRY